MTYTSDFRVRTAWPHGNNLFSMTPITYVTPNNYNDKHFVENEFSNECLASLLSLSVILKAFVLNLLNWPILTDIYALSA